MMATKLTKPVAREVVNLRGQSIIVTLTQVGLELRYKGKRTTYTLPYEQALFRAAQLTADAIVAKRHEEKGPRRRGVKRGLLSIGR